MPSDILLHYNYGAAAVKLWGRGIEVLHGRFNPPRPIKPVLVPSGPSTTLGDRITLAHEFSPAETRLGEKKSDEQATWDAEEVVLFLLANSQVARDRRSKKAQEDAQRMERKACFMFSLGIS